jgi:hypothetical protein
VRGVKAKRVQVDEIWSFIYAQNKNVATAKAAPDGAGDVWTWTALEADTKLIVSRLSTNLPALQQGDVPVMFAPLDARSMTCG